MSFRFSASRAALLLPVGSVLLSMSSYQLGAAVAKGLFPAIGAEGTTALRLIGAALLLTLVWRPWRLRLRRHEWRAIIAYGVALGGLNLLFYMAIQTIPLGVTVAIEFTGPLAVAALFSRKRADLAWVALAAAGVVVLLPSTGADQTYDVTGLLYAGAAAVLWAVYIVLGRRAGTNQHGGRVTALGVCAATLVIAPFGIVHAGRDLLDPAVLPLGMLVAVLSSALPNSLEMVAMKRLPTRVFGVLMSLEPAFGALYGLLLLGERLTFWQWSGIACVVLASGGMTLTGRNLPVEAGAFTAP